MSEIGLYGVIAEFDDKHQIVEAARHAYAEGYRRMDAYTPFPVSELPAQLGSRGTAVPLITLIGGMIWGLGGFFMEWFSMGIAYPLNIGGRPFNSWPNFIPITFEMTILGAALSAVTAMIVLNCLPQPYHPVFNAPNFNRASVDRFFLCIQADDPKFDAARTKTFLQSLQPINVAEVAK